MTARRSAFDLPLGSHRHPCAPDADLGPFGQAAIVRNVIDHLDLRGVALVGNDTGGGIVQLLLAGDTSRVGAVVLTNCDAFEAFPPRGFKPIFLATRRPWRTRILMAPMRLAAARHSPLAYGLLLRRPRPAALTAGWAEPARTRPEIRADLARFAQAMTGDELIDAARWLGRFDGPVRLVWGTADRFFTLKLAKRLLAAFRGSPDVRLIEVAGRRTFIPVDDPAAVADAIRDVTRGPATPTPVEHLDARH